VPITETNLTISGRGRSRVRAGAATSASVVMPSTLRARRAAISSNPAGIQWSGWAASGSSGTRQEFSRYSAAQPSRTAATNVITAVSASSRGTLAVSEPAR
jgi:hypothetical protein